MDSASQHRAAGVFSLTFGAAAITSLAGVFGLEIFSLRAAPLFGMPMLPDGGWKAHWLPGAVTAAYQQNAAIQQWTNIVLIFGVIASVVACVNALIGFVSHANERRYETALRGLVGASVVQLRSAMRRGALIDGLAGAGAGIGVGVGLALVLRRMWASSAGLEPAWALLALSLSLAVAAYASRVTGRRLTRKGWMGDALAPDARTVPGFGAEDLRALLTTAQLACAVALTIVSLMVWSYASTADTVATQQKHDRYVARAQGDHQAVLASVRAAGSAAESIASPGALIGIGRVDAVVSDCGPCVRANMYAPMFALETQHHVAGADFFRVAGIDVVGGREFARDRRGAREVVVNEIFARQAFQGQDPIGKRILVGGFEKGAWYTVIGTVENVKIEGLQYLEAVAPEVGAPAQPGYPPAIYFFAGERAPAEFDVIVQAASSPVLAGLSFEPFARVVARARAPQQSFSGVLSLLGLILCGAAALGTFMTTMLSVQSRRIEIATRRAIGARRRDVRRMVYGRVIGLSLHGVAVGVVVSAALTRALEVFVPGLPVFDGRIALGVCIAFFAITLIAALLPLRAALRIAPAQVHH